VARVLLLIPTASYRAPDFMDAAAKLGLEVVVGSDRGQPLAELFPGRTLTADFSDPESGAAAIARFADSYPLDAILAVDDAGTILAAEASSRLRLPHNPVEAARATRDKPLMRRLLDEAGIASPTWRVIPLDRDARREAGSIDFPCVIKPLALSASRGVIRANNPDEFVAAVGRLREILRLPDVKEECGEAANSYLVEDYLPGDEVSLEGLVEDGALHVLALFDKPDPLTGPFFEETIYVTPSRLPRDRQRSVIDTAEAATRALGIVNGAVHIELRLNDDGVFPIDVAARSIGGLCGRTLSFGVGMSLEELILRHATGSPIESFDRAEDAAGVMMIPIPAGGTLLAVGGLEQARGIPGVDAVTISIPIGHEVVPLPEGSEYLGFIFARGDIPAAVEETLRAAHSCLRFEISETATSSETGAAEAVVDPA